MDGERLEWVRLYPVPFRDLPKVQQFRKYQFVDLVASRPSEDRRPESWRIDPERIELQDTIDTSRGWSKRRPYIEPLMIESMCELQRRQRLDGTSLGAFRPAEILDVEAKEARGWSEAKKVLAAQGKLLGAQDRKPLEPLTWEFRYRYRCSTKGCNTHRQKIIDWELGEAWRKWDGGSEQERVEKIKSRWFEDIAGADKDLVLFVGNMFKRPRQFLVLGTFYPPREATSQEALW